jgi:hypothetical protein
MYALGGSLSIVAVAHVSLSNVNDQGSYTNLDVAQNVLFLDIGQFTNSSNITTEISINSVGGSLYISSRLSVTLTDVSIVACSAMAQHNGAVPANMSLFVTAIGGAAAFLSNSNPFFASVEARFMFTQPSRFSMDRVTFRANRATAIRNVALNSFSNTVVTALGGGVSLLHSNKFGDRNTIVESNHDQVISLGSATFSNNNVSAVFPRQNYVPSSPMKASAVVCGGSM